MEAKKETKSVVSALKTEYLFSKAQLLAAERFQDRRDILNALLSSDQQYAVEAVEQEISKYMKGQVK